MKVETIQAARDLINSGKGWSGYDILWLLMTHEGMKNDYEGRRAAQQLEDLIIRFNYNHHHEQFERQQYHRWQRMNHLIMTKVCNGLPVTQAEKVHCNNSLMLAELYTY